MSAGTSFATSYIHPDPQVRVLSLLSGISSLLIGPITLGSGLPAINAQLQEMGKETKTSSDEWKKRSRVIDELVSGWEKRHNVRYISFAGAWALSAASLLTALSS